jgi:hypothetical protein
MSEIILFRTTTKTTIFDDPNNFVTDSHAHLKIGYRNVAQHRELFSSSSPLNIADRRRTLDRNTLFVDFRRTWLWARRAGREIRDRRGKIRPDTCTRTLRSPRNAGDHLPKSSAFEEISCVRSRIYGFLWVREEQKKAQRMKNATTTHRCDGPRCLLVSRLAPAEYISAARTDGVGIRSLGLYE